MRTGTTLYVLIFFTLCSTYSFASDHDLPVVVVPESGVIVLAGALDQGNLKSRNCKYFDPTKEYIDHSNELPVIKTKYVEGRCTDASITLPKGWMVKDVDVEVEDIDGNKMQCEIPQGMMLCGWSTHKKHTCMKYACGNTPVLVSSKVPINACVGVGPISRSLFNYIWTYPNEKKGNYLIHISVERCDSIEGFESNSLK